MSTFDNPFHAPTSDDLAVPLEDADILEKAESIRREYIQHEASVRSIGLLYYLGAFGCVLGAVALIGAIIAIPERDADIAYAGLISLIVLAFGMIYGVIGYGIRSLAGWSKIPVIILSAISLLSIPIGTLIGGYILYLVLCEKGTMVLSPQYKEIIRLTPHVKYKTSIITIILVVLLLLLLVLAIGAFLLASSLPKEF